MARDSLYISTENDITSYFLLAANRANVIIWWSCSARDFSIKAQPILKRSIALERANESSTNVLVRATCKDTFLPLAPENMST